ncbi:NADH-quinone oxidoreductase subunit NuoN [Erythrobacteraceae bacterium CFH 75059]|uniref:NADH-quinone oxidoreductase subunit NuoN n=1 Tax=Qipengyuania thermophila TaxID=2509361 RepID=UPI00101F9A06|nr:NADH-quinone oxidoreductase subunit NuoN [Qipengyuania thermophila]TCD05290.1 NADH-quinone oxidoreductase subunit NuoN [Erythrobacteraceae bacterium CFH 75059]
MNFATSLMLIGAELGLCLVALVLLLLSAWLPRAAARVLTIAAASALAGASIYTLALLLNGTAGPDANAFGALLRLDAFSAVAKLLIYLSTFACLVVTPSFFERRGQYRGEYPVLLLFNAVGMSLLVSATDLMTLYIGLELSSLSSYILASFARSDMRSAEAGLKYFILGGLASGILLYGMSLVYGFAGSTNFDAIRTALAGELGTGALFGIVLVFAGLAFKISAVPFHMWTPDVYDGAPTPVTTFFAGAPKIAAVAILTRLSFSAFGEQFAAWQQIVAFVALASIVVGALGAIGQENLKRVLAYSSINNVGFLLIGLATGTAAGVSAMLIYLAIYAVMTLGSFVALLMLHDADGVPMETFGSIAGLAQRKPALAWALLVLMFSLAGIPPLFGFYAKLVVFQAAVDAGLIALATVGIAASVIGAFYYIKFVKVMFFDARPSSDARAEVARNPAGHWSVLAASTVLLSPLGFLLTPAMERWAAAAASALFLTA